LVHWCAFTCVVRLRAAAELLAASRVHAAAAAELALREALAGLFSARDP
jgi:hypothetical protein